MITAGRNLSIAANATERFLFSLSSSIPVSRSWLDGSSRHQGLVPIGLGAESPVKGKW